MTTEYTLTKVKTFNGREGQGFNATICCNGIPVAFAFDDASGGDIDISFRNPGQTAASYERHTNTWRAAEAACHEWMRNWYATSPDAEYSRSVDAELDAKYPEQRRERTPEQQGCHALECWLNAMIDKISEEKQLRRWSKTQTCFRLKGDQSGQWRTLKMPVTDPRAVPHLTQKYGDKIERVYQP